MPLQDEEAKLRECVEFIADLDTFALDLETSTYSPFTGRIIGLSISGGPDTEPSDCINGCCRGKLFPRAWYFQFAPEFYVGGDYPDCIPLTVVLEVLRPFLEDPERRISGANIKFDLKFLIANGVDVACRVADVVVASQLLDENRESHSLKKLAKIFLNHDMVEFSELGGLFSPPIGKYGADDACQTHRLDPLLLAKLEAEGLGKLYEELWCRLIPILARMELAGIPVDIEVLEALRDEVMPEIQQVEETCWRLAGQQFDVASADECRRVLFRDLKFKIPKDALTGSGKKIAEAGGRVTWEHTSTSHAVLEDLEEEEKIRRGIVEGEDGEESEPTLVGNILRYRELQKLASSYINNLIEAHGRVDGRIRSSFNQVEHVKGGGGTVTGRLSNSIEEELGGVNIQTIPSRSTTGKKLRKAFIASKGYVLIVADYGNIELRVLAHLSQDPELISAYCDWVCAECGCSGSTLLHLRECPECDTPEGHRRAEKGCKLCVESTRPGDAPRHGYCEGIDLHQMTADGAGITRAQAKCVSLNTLVSTNEGLYRLGDIISDDPDEVDVFQDVQGLHTPSDQGTVSVSSGVFSGLKDSLLVVSKRGVLRCSHEHRFVLRDGSLKRAADLAPGDLLKSANLHPRWVGQVQEAKVSIFGTGEKYSHGPDIDPSGILSLKLDADWGYLAGLIAGDGSVVAGGGYSITVGEGGKYNDWQDTILEHVSKLGIPSYFSTKKTGSGASIRLGSKRVARFLEQLDMSRGPHGKLLCIPWWVLRGSEDVAWAYLAGLLDTDGTITGGNSMSFTTKHPEYAGEVSFVARLLGMLVKVEPCFNKSYKRWYFRVNLSAHSLPLLREKCPLNSYKKAQVDERLSRLREPAPRPAWFEDEVLLVLRGRDGSANRARARSLIYLQDEDPIQMGDLCVRSQNHLYAPGGLLTHNSVNFGVVFGIGPKKLARQMRATPKAATKALDAYFKKYREVDRFSDSICSDLRKQGYVKTLLGRRRRIPGARGNTFDRSSREWRQCMSARVQGGAADILAVATRNIGERLRREKEPAQILLSVHDELVSEARMDRADYVEGLIRDEMEAALRLRIPLVADVKRGASWGEAKK